MRQRFFRLMLWTTGSILRTGFLHAQAVSPATTGLRVVSPNGVVKVALELDARGALFYQVDYAGHAETVTAVSRSALGITRSDADLSMGLEYAGIVSERKVVDDYRMLHGKRAHCRNEAREKIFRFRNKDGQIVDVVFRAYNNGAAFRYVFPDKPKVERAQAAVRKDSCRITGERTRFAVPEGTERWMQPYTSAYEALYQLRTKGSGDKPEQREWGFPALYKVKDKPVWVLITEADVTRANCASRLSNREDENSYMVMMPETEVVAAMPWQSAWRVIIAGSLSDIVESTLVADVSEPSKLGATDWIRPGAAAWVYWANNHGSKDYRKVVEYVDLAKKMHWPYVLIDWEWDRMGNGGTIEDAVAYARSKGIRPLMWYNSKDSANSSVGLDPYGRLQSHAARCKEFEWLNRIGVYGVKVDFFEDDRQREMAYCIDILKDAARYHLLVDLHGATVPRGWDRTYPNLMTVEAVYGAEWYGYSPLLTNLGASHNATLPFTRNVIGPMDYTPVTFSNITFPHTTTYAHELALSVVFESGLQHFADKPESFYALPPGEQRFLMTVPVAWQDTRLIDGFPGKRVVIARRSGRSWYIGGLNGEDRGQSLDVSFGFLGGGEYELSLISDGETAKAFARKTVTVRKGSRVSVDCLPRGGFAATLKPRS